MGVVSTISEQVAQMHLARASEPVDEGMAAGPEQAEMAAGGLPAGVAEVGMTVPDVEMLDVHGSPTTLYQATAGRTTVVVFYRGTWCPYCNIALATYKSQLHPQLTQRGVELVALSPQRPDGSLSMQEKNDIAFTVLSDPGNTLARHLGILTQPSEDARAAQLRFGLDLTAVNADGTIDLPMPTTVILDNEHVLRWIDVHPDYRTRTEPNQILGALDHLGRLTNPRIPDQDS